MATKRFVIALDQGTTSSRAILFNERGSVCASAQHEFTQYYPQPGWVEHDPQEILSSQLGALTSLIVTSNITPDQIDSIGITNQRETTLLWDRKTGAPVGNAIVWQCRRTAQLIEELCSDPKVTKKIIEKTGLIPDAYFSASKIRWMLDNIEGARERAERGELAFGTVDSWLIWSLTNGAVHATDKTNASRTMLYNIHSNKWDPWLLKLFDIPDSLLPEVRPSSANFGVTAHHGVISGIPICGVAGDQQSALFGQKCFGAGEAKNTNGTGCFLLMHTGFEACESKNQLITTIAASAPDTEKTENALEGSVFVAGALIQWLRDELRIIRTAASTQKLAMSVKDTAGVYIVPAFTGLGAPWWDADARGIICGLTRGAHREHIVRAALESLAYQVNDLVSAIEEDSNIPINALNVDGGASKNDFLMQFQSDILNTSVIRPAMTETTALGAAFLAGLYTGYWKNTDELRNLKTSKTAFESCMKEETRQELLKGWQAAVTMVRTTPN